MNGCLEGEVLEGGGTLTSQVAEGSCSTRESTWALEASLGREHLGLQPTPPLQKPLPVGLAQPGSEGPQEGEQWRKQWR